MSPGAFLLPLGAGFGYAWGAIAVKRALGAGISGSWVNFLCNTVMALFFQIFWIFPGKLMVHGALFPPFFCGILFFLGQIFTFRAIATGDVSIATPLLGTKVILVALFSLFVMRASLPGTWWMASLLASVGIALISYSPGGFHRRLAVTIGWSLGAAALFALTDVCVQHWVPLIGYSRFAPLMFGTVGLLSLIYLPSLLKEKKCRKQEGNLKHQEHSLTQGTSYPADAWLAGGALLMGLQSLGMYSAIGLYGSATVTNILYGSRCLWSVLLVWIFGSLAGESPLLGNRSTIMGWRFVGALFLFSAMALVLHGDS